MPRGNINLHKNEQDGNIRHTAGRKDLDHLEKRHHSRACNFIKSAMRSFARVAKMGAATFSDFYTPGDNDESRSHSPSYLEKDPGKRRIKPNPFQEQMKSSNGPGMRFSSMQSQWQLKLDNLMQKQRQSDLRRAVRPWQTFFASDGSSPNIDITQQKIVVKQSKAFDNYNHGVSNEDSLEITSRQERPPNHFIQETLAYIAGGAAASSAFAAVTASALFATTVVAAGALMSALLADGEGAENAWNRKERLHLEHFSDESMHTTEDVFVGDDQDCRVDEIAMLEGQTSDLQQIFEKKFPRGLETNTQFSSHSPVLNALTMDELKKCFYGKPTQNEYGAIFETHIGENGVCSAGHHDVDDTMKASEVLDITPIIELGAVNDISSHRLKNNECNKMEHEEDPMEPIRKRVEVVWHDAYGSAANAYYYTRQQEDNKRRTANESNNERFSRTRNQQRNSRKPLKYVLHKPEYEDSDEHWVAYTDAERDGARLLSESFRVASSTFGLVADAVRFTGETAAATAGGTARLLGGVVRVGGWAVESIGTAIECASIDTDDDDDNDVVKNHLGSVSNQIAAPETNERAKKRSKIFRNTRKIAGTSVRLVGDAIGQVSDSLLLAGSAAERVGES